VSSSYDSAVIDTAMIEDVRMLLLPRSVRLLYLEALVWAKLRRTDGLIPRAALPRVTDEPDPELAAARLVEVGLLDNRPEGWQITDFERTQMSAKRVAELQAEAKRRYDEYRTRHPRKRVSNTDSNADSNGDANGPARPPARPPKGRRQAEGGSADGVAPRAASAPVAPTPLEREERVAENRALLDSPDPGIRRAAAKALELLEATGT
jgi:hypothetical protein